MAAETLGALQNPAAHLRGVDERLGDAYHRILYEGKAEKAEAVANRSLQMNKTLDAYDEMLTQAEIQGFISKVKRNNNARMVLFLFLLLLFLLLLLLLLLFFFPTRFVFLTAFCARLARVQLISSTLASRPLISRH